MFSSRRSIRLSGYDYTTAGAYFVTLVTARRVNWFGKIQVGEMQYSPSGEIAQSEWIRLGIRFEGIALDEYVIMPNHLHGILWIMPGDRIQHTSVDEKRTDFARTLGTLIGSYKSSSTRLIHNLERSTERAIWQRNYYEHILRSAEDLEHAREYIHNNPLRWSEDQENVDQS